MANLLLAGSYVDCTGNNGHLQIVTEIDGELWEIEFQGDWENEWIPLQGNFVYEYRMHDTEEATGIAPDNSNCSQNNATRPLSG